MKENISTRGNNLRMFFCGREGQNVCCLKDIINSQVALTAENGNDFIKKKPTTLFKKDQILAHMYLRVKNSRFARKKIIELLEGENRANIETFYQLYGDFDFCVELQGGKTEVNEIINKIKSALEDNDQLLNSPGSKETPLVKRYSNFYKLHGIDRHDIQDGVYFIDFEKTNCMGVFVHVSIIDSNEKYVDSLYKNIFSELEKEDLDSFIYSASYSEENNVLWFMLLAECDEYYKLNDVSDVLDEIVEQHNLKKVTYPIAGFIHNDASNEGFKMVINFRDSGPGGGTVNMNTKSKKDKNVIKMLANNYSNEESIKNLWENAGGDIGAFAYTPNPKDTWTALWRKAQEGASASPISIVMEALDDFPSNPELVAFLDAKTDPLNKEAIQKIVSRLESLPIEYTEDNLFDILLESPKLSADDAFMEFVPEVTGRIENNKRDKLTSALSKIAKATVNGVTEGGKAVIEATAKGITEALLRTNGIGS